jgi:hypothetical protein
VLRRGKSSSGSASAGTLGGSSCLASKAGVCGSSALGPSAAASSCTRDAGSQCFHPKCQTQALGEMVPRANAERRSEREIDIGLPCALAQRQMSGFTANLNPFRG